MSEKMFKFNPNEFSNKNKQFVKLKPGVCDFTIINAVKKVSKAGNEMLKITFKVCDQEFNEGIVFDYITTNMVWKLKSLMSEVGLNEEFKNGEIDVDTFQNLTGKMILDTKIFKTETEEKEAYVVGKYGDSEKTIKPKIQLKDSIPSFNDDDIRF